MGPTAPRGKSAVALSELIDTTVRDHRSSKYMNCFLVNTIGYIKCPTRKLVPNPSSSATIISFIHAALASTPSSTPFSGARALCCPGTHSPPLGWSPLRLPSASSWRSWRTTGSSASYPGTSVSFDTSAPSHCSSSRATMPFSMPALSFSRALPPWVLGGRRWVYLRSHGCWLLGPPDVLPRRRDC